MYRKNFFIHTDCFSSFEILLLTIESNLFFPGGFFTLIAFPASKDFEKVHIWIKSFQCNSFFPMVFSLPAACHWWPWWPQVGTPNLQNVLLLPSFATLVSTMLGYPQKCPPYLTHICPISKFSFSYLPLPTYYIWLTPTNITFTRNANIHGFCFLDELIQTLSLKEW